jgi:hypothetical protein
MGANSDVWSHGVAHTIQTSGANDVLEEVWYLAQTPWVLLHGHNPFVNNWLNTPVGVNLMDNTSMPLLGVLGFPITWLFGPIATFNVMMDVAIFSSAMAFFVMARRFVQWWPAAFVGGLLYGFSPFTSGEANGHLFLVFQAVPPLVVFFVDRYFRSESASPWKAGLWIGACFVVQFYISTEVFASLVVMTLIATVVGLLFMWRSRTTVDVARLGKMLGCAAIVVALGAGYGALIAVAGPGHIHGPAQPATAIAGETNDPVGLFAPTLDQRFTFGHTALGNSLVAARDPNWNIVFDSPVENGSYVGVPLFVALVAGTVVLRRRRIALFCAVMAVIAMVMSLGPHLHVDGHRTGIPLPFIVIAHLPLLDSSVASRWVTYFWLFAALLLAIIVDRVYARSRRKDGAADLRGVLVSGVLAVCVLLPLVPAWPYSARASDVPTWFTSEGASLPAGSVAVVYPYASASDASAMLWQAMANMSFRMPGGYAIIPDANGTSSFSSQATPLQEALATCQAGVTPAMPPQVVRSQLRYLDARTVVVDPSAAGAGCAEALFRSAIGAPRAADGVLVWSPKL